MRILSGLMVACSCVGLLLGVVNQWNTTEFADGETATAFVVGRADSLAGAHMVVRFTDRSGQTHERRLATAGELPFGSPLTISYQPDSPGDVRAPELRSPTSHRLGYIALGIGSMLLWNNPWTRNRRAEQLAGPLMSKPDRLLEATREVMGPHIGGAIKSAFPVVERKSIMGSHAPLPLQNKRFGIVAVTADEYVLVDVPRRRLSQATVADRLPRTTRLPKVQVHHGAIQGGPLPFVYAARSGARWHYAGTGYARARHDFSDLINELRRTGTRSSDAPIGAGRVQDTIRPTAAPATRPAATESAATESATTESATTESAITQSLSESIGPAPSDLAEIVSSWPGSPVQD